MAFKVVKKGLKFFVENSTTKKVMGFHDTKEKAFAQVHEIQDSEHSVRKELGKAKVFLRTEKPPKPQGEEEVDDID